MNRYRLDARRFAGPLCAPTHNDSETHDSDDWETVRATGRALLARGFTVWIYERVPRPGGPVTVDRRPTGAVDLHLIDHRTPPRSAAGAYDVHDA